MSGWSRATLFAKRRATMHVRWSGDETHTRLVRHLVGSSRRWAPTASVLVANLCHRYVEKTEWDCSEFALDDLGQAVAHMTAQAAALGMSAELRRPAVESR